jgi:hypothetical protein
MAEPVRVAVWAASFVGRGGRVCSLPHESSRGPGKYTPRVAARNNPTTQAPGLNRLPDRCRVCQRTDTPKCLQQARGMQLPHTRSLLHTVALAALLSLPLAARAQVSIGIGIDLPGVSIGINAPSYPRLVRVPGYPVYYDPRADANYFFYDGLYWVYRDDTWYESSWYDGPWRVRHADSVPDFVLRVPVRYYRQPPSFFRGWRADAAPRWDEHWGNDWQQRRPGWNRWDRRHTPSAAPLPSYQRRYDNGNYPREPERQRALHDQNYHRPPHGAVPSPQQHAPRRTLPPQRVEQPQQQPRDSRDWRDAREARQPPSEQHHKPGSDRVERDTPDGGRGGRGQRGEPVERGDGPDKRNDRGGR